MADDHYRTLRVSKEATEQEIKKAFRRIARECHPDVSDNDPDKAERFKQAKGAYEVLSDPVKRARYDRRGRAPRGGSFFDAFYRATGERGTAAGGKARTTGRTRGRAAPSGNDLDLEDLFNDFGMGASPGKPGRTRTRTTSGERRAPRARPVAGDDVHVEVDIPASIASKGGTVTSVYYRMQRADAWRPGSPDAGVVRIQDIADIRVIPGTPDGEILRERGQGDAGAHGGPFGDLVVTVRVVGGAGRRSTATAPTDDRVTLDVSVAEALLGGRVELRTPQGRVRLSVPPCTSSGSVLRLRGKGPPDDQGDATDLSVVVRIVVPRSLDQASKDLIDEFARLNPESPRD